MNKNHPNRNYRARMHAALADWQASFARVLWEMPIVTEPKLLAEGIKHRCKEAFIAGYLAGRKSMKGTQK